MSSTAETETEADECCANCGVAEIDDVKLEECGGCDLVKYCGDECREEHREQHSEECKHYRRLFTQPDETYLGECPLCFLPMLDTTETRFYTCCSQIICLGCIYANSLSNNWDIEKAGRCPFCRESVNDHEKYKKRQKERIKANDPAALREMAKDLYQEGDYDGAFEYLTKATESGDVDGHYSLGNMYWKGEGVEKDWKKSIYHWERAAIGGHSKARYFLAVMEASNGNVDRAVKHYIISANLGYELSMKALWGSYSSGNITKEDLDATLRTHQAAIDAAKSEHRDKASR